MSKPKNSHEAMTVAERENHAHWLACAKEAKTKYMVRMYGADMSRMYAKEAKKIVDRAQRRFRKQNPEQYTFNVVVKAMKKQGWKKSTEPGGDSCMYRGAGGTVCAAGALIPDSMVKEHNVISQLPEACEHIKRKYGVHFRFVLTLQYAHDDADPENGTLQNFKDFARQHGLEFPA